MKADYRGCSACPGVYAMRADGTMRSHRVEGRRCTGSFQPPRGATPVLVDGPAPCGCEFDSQSSDPIDVWIGCLLHSCDHSWSGWTRLPGTTEDFRRCGHCQLIQMQQRQPCALCAAADARAYEVPDYGTAYVCTTCLQGATA